MTVNPGYKLSIFYFLCFLFFLLLFLFLLFNRLLLPPPTADGEPLVATGATGATAAAGVAGAAGAAGVAGAAGAAGLAVDDAAAPISIKSKHLVNPLLDDKSSQKVKDSQKVKVNGK